MQKPVRIGTRRSQLALWQTRHVCDLLAAAGLNSTIVEIDTRGDQIQNVSISKIGSKGVFTEELEEQLASGDIDIAVHSAKDMPSELPAGFDLIAFTQREAMHDVLVSSKAGVELSRTAAGCCIGSSSVRRRALVRAYYPQFELTDMRGNLQTRLRKLEEGQCDAILLAYAGVKRMGYEDMVVQHLPLDPFIPPVGQGSIAVEAHEKIDPQVKEMVRRCVNHGPTETCLLAERAFLKRLQGGCSVPVFALAQQQADGIAITGGVVSLDGQTILKETRQGPEDTAAAQGTELAQAILDQGGGALLQQIRAQQAAEQQTD